MRLLRAGFCDPGGGGGEADYCFGVLDLAVGYELEGVGEREAFDLDEFVEIEVLLGFGQVGREIDVHFLGEEAGGNVEFGDQFDVCGRDADLFFELAEGAGFWVFAFFERAGGDLEQVFFCRVAVLTD